MTNDLSEREKVKVDLAILLKNFHGGLTSDTLAKALNRGRLPKNRISVETVEKYLNANVETGKIRRLKCTDESRYFPEEYLTRGRSENAPFSFEKFIEGPPANSPNYGNFPFFFYPRGMFGLQMRTTEPFKRFRISQPNLEKEITEEVTLALDRQVECHQTTFKILEPLEPKLYRAYRIMKGVGFSNQELFVNPRTLQ